MKQLTKNPIFTAWLRLICVAAVLFMITTLLTVDVSRRSPYRELLPALKAGAIATLLAPAGPFAFAGRIPGMVISGMLWVLLMYQASRSNMEKHRRTFYTLLIIIICLSLLTLIFGYCLSMIFQMAI